MKDKRIWKFKRRAEEDNSISAGACRCILRIASFRYCTAHHPADAEFALTWREIASWYDNEGPEVIRDKKTIYGWLRELVRQRYLFYNGRKGCPATSCYRLDLDYEPEPLALFNWAAERGRDVFKKSDSDGRKIGQLEGRKIGQLEGRKIGQLEGRKIGQLEGRKIPPPINSYSLREEMNEPKGKKSSRSQARGQEIEGGNNSSLRSNGKGGSAEIGASAPTGESLSADGTVDQASDQIATAPDSASLRCASPEVHLKLWKKARKEAGI